MPAYYYSSTAGAYTLTGAINASATTIGLNSVAGLPGTAPFKVVLEPGQPSEEIVKVTAVAGTSLTVVRGWNGTSGVSHAAGVTVRHMLTAEDLTLSRAHEDATAAHGATGANVGTTNTQILTNKDLTSGTNTFPSTLATKTGVEQLTNKTLITTNTATPAVIIKSVNGIATDIAQILDYNGTPLAKFQNNAFTVGLGFFVPYDYAVGVFGATAFTTSTSAGVRGLVVRGAASQTANLQEWRNSGDSVLASVDKDGKLVAPNVTATNSTDISTNTTNIGALQTATAKHTRLMKRTTTLSVPDGGSTVIASYNTTLHTDGSITQSAGVYTVPVTGLYLWNGTVDWAALAATSGAGRRRLSVRVNGVAVDSGTQDDLPGSGVSLNTNMTQSTSALIHLNAGDTVQMVVFNTTGQNLTINVGAEFGLSRIA